MILLKYSAPLLRVCSAIWPPSRTRFTKRITQVSFLLNRTTCVHFLRPFSVPVQRNCSDFVAKMKFLTDNCIKEIKSPKGITINCFDYRNDLNLITSFEWNSQIANVWNPDTKEIVKEIDLMECHADLIFLPEGRYIAVAWDEGHHGSGVCIYSIDSGEEVLDMNETQNGECLALAVTPENSVLAGSGFNEYKIDYKAMKLVGKKAIFDTDIDGYSMECMCCSKSNYTFLYSPGMNDEESDKGVRCVNVEFSSSGEAETTEEIITHCFVDGEEIDFEIENVLGLAHDGEFIVVATENKIIALESSTDGSIGHVIVSTGISSPEGLHDGQLRLDDKGHLMVCNGNDVISVYQYREEINSLQGLCRHKINSWLKYAKSKVQELPLPKSMKNFLLYKV